MLPFTGGVTASNLSRRPTDDPAVHKSAAASCGDFSAQRDFFLGPARDPAKISSLDGLLMYELSNVTFFFADVPAA